MDFIIKPANDEETMRMLSSTLVLDMLSNNGCPSKRRNKIISGRELKEMCEHSGLTGVPLIVRNINDSDACILKAGSNILHTEILPSEKAWAYKMRLEAVKHQGERTDLSPDLECSKIDSAKEVGREFNVSKRQIHRYIRLTMLIPKLLEMVDKQMLPFSSAIELSFLTAEEQEFIYYFIESEHIIPTSTQASKLKKLSQKHILKESDVYEILKGETHNTKTKIEISTENLSKYFPSGTTSETIEKTILKALKLYTDIQLSMGF